MFKALYIALDRFIGWVADLLHPGTSAADCRAGLHQLEPYAVHHLDSGAMVNVRRCSGCDVMKAKYTSLDTLKAQGLA